MLSRIWATPQCNFNHSWTTRIYTMYKYANKKTFNTGLRAKKINWPWKHLRKHGRWQITRIRRILILSLGKDILKNTVWGPSRNKYYVILFHWQREVDAGQVDREPTWSHHCSQSDWWPAAWLHVKHRQNPQGQKHVLTVKVNEFINIKTHTWDHHCDGLLWYR